MATYVNEKTCQERFERILSNQERTDGKIDNMVNVINELKIDFTAFGVGRETIIKRLDKIEETKEIEVKEETKKLKDAPERRKLDRRYIVGILATIFFSTGSLIIGLVKLIVG